MRYRFIQQHHQYPVERQCQVLGVSVSGYYAWRSRRESQRAQRDRQLVIRIQAVFEQHRQRYGSPRIHRELQEQGIICSRKCVARLMRSAWLRARGRRRFKRTTDSKHRYAIAPNHLARGFTLARIGGLNRVWAGDITYLATREGWLYLAVLLDLHSRRVVGWAMGNTLEQSLTQQPLERALALRQPTVGLLHHSDRGSQYAASEYQGQLAQQGIVCSMSRRGERPLGRAGTMPLSKVALPHSRRSWSASSTGALRAGNKHDRRWANTSKVTTIISAGTRR